MLNKKQALELFKREAICFGEEDGVPVFRVRQLLREKYAGWSHFYSHLDGGIFQLDDDYECAYLSLLGFLQAVGEANVEELLKIKQSETITQIVYSHVKQRRTHS